jgi:hypothetical protein
MNSKYPTNGKPRPYAIDPFVAPLPDWFIGDEQYYTNYCICAYFNALEYFMATRSDRFLKQELLEFASENGPSDYIVPCTLSIDIDIYVEMMEAEVAYRRKVDTERKRKLLKK